MLQPLMGFHIAAPDIMLLACSLHESKLPRELNGSIFSDLTELSDANVQIQTELRHTLEE